MDFHKISRIRQNVLLFVLYSDYSCATIFPDIRSINFAVFVHKYFITKSLSAAYFDMVAFCT